MRRLRSQSGHTLPELLTALMMATVILLATFALLDHVLKRTSETQARVEATQKGRMAMDTISRSLRSSVCLSPTTPPVALATDNAVTYYSDLGDGRTSFPERHALAYNTGTRRLTDTVTPGLNLPPNTTFPGASQPRQLAENVVPEGSTAVFRFYAYDTNDPPTASLLLPTPVATADLGRIARVSITYVARAGAGTTESASRAAVSFTDDVYFRSADPNDPAPYPTCA
jgi:Tfp pilus assembly protein PilW